MSEAAYKEIPIPAELAYAYYEFSVVVNGIEGTLTDVESHVHRAINGDKVYYSLTVDYDGGTTCQTLAEGDTFILRDFS